MPTLQPPFKAVKVTWALFHTQSCLAVDGEARVRSRRGERLPSLFAASGYLSGNGLLTATVLGRVAGESAAALLSRAG